MSTGSMRSAASSGGRVVSVIGSPFVGQEIRLCAAAALEVSDIQETHVFGVAGDEAAACLDVLAHQDREQFVGRGGIVEGDLAQHPHRGVHGGLPEFLGVHLAETLVPLDAVVFVDGSEERRVGKERAARRGGYM